MVQQSWQLGNLLNFAFGLPVGMVLVDASSAEPSVRPLGVVIIDIDVDHLTQRCPTQEKAVRQKPY